MDEKVRKKEENPYYRSKSDVMNTIMYGDNAKPVAKMPTPSRKMSTAKMSKGKMQAGVASEKVKPLIEEGSVFNAVKKEPAIKLVDLNESAAMKVTLPGTNRNMSDSDFSKQFDIPVKGIKKAKKPVTKQASTLIDTVMFIVLFASLLLTFFAFGIDIIPTCILAAASATLVMVITFFGVTKSESKLIYVSLFLVYACVMGGLSAILRATLFTSMSYIKMYLWTSGIVLTTFVGLAEIINSFSDLFTSSKVRQLQKITKN